MPRKAAATTPRKKTGPKGPVKPMSDAMLAQVVEMVRIQCTQDEICAILSMSEQTLDLRLKGHGYANFRDCTKRHGSEGKASLRRMQWKSATDGNVTSQIWLGKQLLGQRDNMELSANMSVTISRADADL